MYSTYCTVRIPVGMYVLSVTYRVQPASQSCFSASTWHCSVVRALEGRSPRRIKARSVNDFFCRLFFLDFLSFNRYITVFGKNRLLLTEWPQRGADYFSIFFFSTVSDFRDCTQPQNNQHIINTTKPTHKIIIRRLAQNYHGSADSQHSSGSPCRPEHLREEDKVGLLFAG